MWGSGSGSDGHGRLVDYGNHVARQTERSALVDGKGRRPIHRNSGRKRWFRRFVHRLRNRNAEHQCSCPTPPAPGRRHTLACEMRNDGYGTPFDQR